MVLFCWGKKRDSTGWAIGRDRERCVIDAKAAVAEFIAMALFVIFGCGIACANGASDAASRLLVAFAFGMGILVLAYSIGHHSGGQINCAVTLSLVLGGQVKWYQGVANVFMQLLGSVAGACVLCVVFPCGADKTTGPAGGLGTNAVDPGFSSSQALVAEILGTFLLCYTVWETAVSPLAKIGQNSCIAIGFSVFLAHLLLLPIDGCSINPTRSFGPAIVSAIRDCPETTGQGLEDLWIFWVGPLAGAALAALVQHPMVKEGIKEAKVKEAERIKTAGNDAMAEEAVAEGSAAC